MYSVTTKTQLEQLRPSDRIKYHGVQWHIQEYSTYDDSYGYETTEWLLKSQAGKEYYLLREIDPQNPESLVNWYLAEEIPDPKIFDPESLTNVAVRLWHDMQEQKMPYPELQALGRRYYFESLTKGNYEGDEEETSRITWDYWDKDRQWNLAIEAWPNGKRHIYSTKVVKPEEFSNIEQGGNTSNFTSFIAQVLLASFIMICGIFLMIFG
jgi:hypothetical protein